MAYEPGLNMQYFNENINDSANINNEYKKTLEKEDHIVLGECYLNYLFSDELMKPFVRKKYELKDDKKNSYLEKLNIFNYKGIFNDLLNKKKRHFVTLDNELIRRFLNALNANHELNNNYINRYKYKKNNIKNTKYSLYLDNNSSYNKTVVHNKNKLQSSFDQSMLPKIMKKKNKEKLGNKNTFDLSNDIFRTTSCAKQNDDKKYEKEIMNVKKVHFYSPLLKKNLINYFQKVEDRENQSVKKSRIIKDGIDKINKKKFNIESYDFNKNKYDIKLRRNDSRKYFIINKFPNLGKIRDLREIEKTLFNRDENITFSKLRAKLEKQGMQRIRNYLHLKIVDE